MKKIKITRKTRFELPQKNLGNAKKSIQNQRIPYFSLNFENWFGRIGVLIALGFPNPTTSALSSPPRPATTTPQRSTTLPPPPGNPQVPPQSLPLRPQSPPGLNVQATAGDLRRVDHPEACSAQLAYSQSSLSSHFPDPFIHFCFLLAATSRTKTNSCTPRYSQICLNHS